MTIRQNGCGNSPLCSAAWLDIAGATHYTRWLCCHQLYLTPLKWKKERSFPFPASSTHFPSSIVPKKVVVVVESIDFTWSYLSLSSFLSALTNQSTHLTPLPPPCRHRRTYAALHQEKFFSSSAFPSNSWKQRDHLAPFRDPMFAIAILTYIQWGDILFEIKIEIKTKFSFLCSYFSR